MRAMPLRGPRPAVRSDRRRLNGFERWRRRAVPSGHRPYRTAVREVAQVPKGTRRWKVRHIRDRGHRHRVAPHREHRDDPADLGAGPARTAVRNMLAALGSSGGSAGHVRIRHCLGPVLSEIVRGLVWAVRSPPPSGEVFRFQAAIGACGVDVACPRPAGTALPTPSATPHPRIPAFDRADHFAGSRAPRPIRFRTASAGPGQRCGSGGIAADRRPRGEEVSDQLSGGKQDRRGEDYDLDFHASATDRVWISGCCHGYALPAVRSASSGLVNTFLARATTSASPFGMPQARPETASTIIHAISACRSSDSSSRPYPR